MPHDINEMPLRLRKCRKMGYKNANTAAALSLSLEHILHRQLVERGAPAALCQLRRRERERESERKRERERESGMPRIFVLSAFGRITSPGCAMVLCFSEGRSEEEMGREREEGRDTGREGERERERELGEKSLGRAEIVFPHKKADR